MPLDVGDKAPEFELRDQHGQSVSLATFRGVKSVLLVFYPFAFSGVCTGELRSLRDNAPDGVGEKVELLAVSCDPMYALRAFADSDDLGFSLLSDFWPHGAVASDYGVFDAQRGCATRSSFVIDREGVVRWQFHNEMPDARDLSEYSRVLAEL